MIKQEEKEKIIINDSQLIEPILDPSLFEDKNILDYECMICKNIPNPHKCYESICCGRLFCVSCIQTWLRRTKRCPLCAEFMKEGKEYLKNIETDSKLIYKMLLKLKLKCPYNCEWEGPFSELDDHLKKCDLKLYGCKYSEFGCKFNDKKNKCEEHEKNNDEEHLQIIMDFIDKNYYLGNKIKFDDHCSYKVSCHPHPLTFTPGGAWYCQGRHLDGGCLSPSFMFNNSYNYRCTPCNFDLCPYCFLKYVIVDDN